MTVTIQQTEKLMKGNHSFSQLGFSMMLTRLKSIYAKDSSRSTLRTCMSEINTFLAKFAGIMGADFEIISKI